MSDLLDVEKSEDFFAENHENEVQNPNDSETTDQSDDCSNNLAFLETCDNATDPCRYGDDCQNQADNITQTKVITFFCHNERYLHI